MNAREYERKTLSFLVLYLNYQLLKAWYRLATIKNLLSLRAYNDKTINCWLTQLNYRTLTSNNYILRLSTDTLNSTREFFLEQGLKGKKVWITKLYKMMWQLCSSLYLCNKNNKNNNTTNKTYQSLEEMLQNTLKRLCFHSYTYTIH